jgi:MFS transporter, DHA1 family, multidrug resistance protein
MQISMSRGEFIALIAMMFATIAFSIDAMLPALPEIGRELSAQDANRAQLVLTSFVLGLGIGTFFTGPLSDTFGRKPVIFSGCALYIVAAAVAWQSDTLEWLLVARVFQGVGAASPRVVGLAVMRDLFSGREMARMMSIAMMVFTIFPAVAPLIGAGIIKYTGWRGIFLAFILFAAISVIWTAIRLPESLPSEKRRPFQTPVLVDAVRQMFAHPTVRLSILVQSFCFGILFTMLSMVQPVYDLVFDQAASFPFWFGAVALVSASASILNAALVVRVGMRRMVTWSLASQILFSGLVLILSSSGLPRELMFIVFVTWQATVFFMAGTTLGNLNAIAMEPMGHIAGTASSVIGSIATVFAVAIAAPLGLMFDGTLLPLTAGILLCSMIGFLLMLRIGRHEARFVF